MTGWQPVHAYCDHGYRGASKEVTVMEVHSTSKKRKSMKPSI